MISANTLFFQHEYYMDATPHKIHVGTWSEHNVMYSILESLCYTSESNTAMCLLTILQLEKDTLYEFVPLLVLLLFLIWLRLGYPDFSIVIFTIIIIGNMCNETSRIYECPAPQQSFTQL